MKGAEVKHNGGISPELRNKGVRELEKGAGPSCDEALGFLPAHDRPPTQFGTNSTGAVAA